MIQGYHDVEYYDSFPGMWRRVVWWKKSYTIPK
jgi:hypothetical protein